MMNFIDRVETARNGTNPAVICRLPSGWVALCDMQYLRGYCILLCDPVVESINALDLLHRIQFFTDMSIVGDALLQVTGACRINYGLLSNSDPYLHAHIVPRYLNEPAENLHHLPWSYTKEFMNSRPFDLNKDRGLMSEIRSAIESRCSEISNAKF